MLYAYTPEAVRVLYEERLREAEAERFHREMRDGLSAPRTSILPALQALLCALRPSEHTERVAGLKHAARAE